MGIDHSTCSIVGGKDIERREKTGVIVLSTGREQRAECLYLWTQRSSPLEFSQVERSFRSKKAEGMKANPSQCGSVSPTPHSQMGTRAAGAFAEQMFGGGFLTLVELPAHGSVSVLG